MRLPTVIVSGAALAAAFFAGASYGEAQAQAQATSKVTNLFQGALDAEFAPGREVLVDLVEIPPNATLDRHWHPGEEFHYYLAGEPEVTLGDAAPVRPALGTVGHVPFRMRHRAGAGPAGATVLVFRVHTTGEPWRHLDDEHADGADAVRR